MPRSEGGTVRQGATFPGREAAVAAPSPAAALIYPPHEGRASALLPLPAPGNESQAADSHPSEQGEAVSQTEKGMIKTILIAFTAAAVFVLLWNMLEDYLPGGIS